MILWQNNRSFGAARKHGIFVRYVNRQIPFTPPEGGKKMKQSRKVVILAAALCFAGFTASAGAATLKASHQWPGGKGDVRDEMVQIIAKEVEKAGVDLTIKIYPGKSLFKPKEQWNAMVKGQLDISRLNSSPFMDDIKKIINDAGVVVLADAWLAGGFASKKNCILEPESIKGQVTRAAGPAFEKMLAGAGASISSMSSSAIYQAMQTGVLDAANTSSGSFVSYRIYEQVKCLTAPGDYALWFMYEPILMSKKSWDKLNKAQQDALMAAGKKAEEYMFAEAKGLDSKMVDIFTKAGVQVVTMTAEQAAAWRAIANETSYKSFAEGVPGGKELIEKALAVE
jgi:TRAP-type C4-dicarboxylate transport system substrate-binding protein